MLVLVVASALLIGLAVPRTGEAACPADCADYPDYEITIQGNICQPINGTWDIFRLGCTWGRDMDPPFEEIDVSCWENEWFVVIYHEKAPPTVWKRANTADDPVGPYQHVFGPCQGGFIMVHV